MPAWEIAISPVHTEAFRNFSASAVGIASLSSWLVANRFSISDIGNKMRNDNKVVNFFSSIPITTTFEQEWLLRSSIKGLIIADQLFAAQLTIY